MVTDGMSPECVQKYLTRKKAVDLYIDGVSPKIVSQQTKLSNSYICYLINRCTTMDQNTGEVPGYSSLIPRKILNHEHTKIESFFDSYPEIGKRIRGTYFGDKKYTQERCINIRTLHGIFIRECRNAGIQDYEFPFTTQDFAYRSLQRYIKKIENLNMDEAIKRQGKDQRQQFNSTGFGVSYGASPKAPYDVVQTDGHKIDVLTVVDSVDTNGEPIKDISTRMWLIAVIDVATRCIIGYSVSPNMNYNQFDILEALKNSISVVQNDRG